MSTRADEPSGTTYLAVPARADTLCDWCNRRAVAVVVAYYPGTPFGRSDRMCSTHLNEYHPTLTVTV